MIYIIIFISKLLENTLATLRIILIANNKKLIGAILTFAISVIWTLSVSFIVVDFKDYFKILSFALGSSVGSYLGNFIEEKIALGCIIITFTINNSEYEIIKAALNKYNKTITKTKNGYKFELNIKRKYQNKVIKLIKTKNNKIKINIIKVFNC